MDAAYLPSAVFFSSGPATVLISGVVTSAGKYILVGFWQPVIPQQMLISHWSHILSLKMSSPPSISRLSPLILHLTAKCISLNNFQWLPIVSIIMGKGSHPMFIALPVLVQALSSLFSSLSCVCALDSSQPNPQSSTLNSANAGSGLPRLFHL